mgnify:CR=1 FL=1
MLCIALRHCNGTYKVYGGDMELVSIFSMQDFVNLFKKSIALTNKPATIFFKDIPDEYPYTDDKCIMKKMNGNGQRKLCLEQIQFLTKYKDQVEILLYTGSGPGQMSGYVYNLFPRIKYIMVDPHDHNLFMGTTEDYLTKTYNFKESKHMYKHMNKIVYLYDNGVIKTTALDYPANIYDFKNDKIHQLDRNADAAIIKSIMKTNVFKKEYATNIKRLITTSKYNFFIIQDFFTNNTASVFYDVLKDTNFAYTSDIRSRDEEIIDYGVFWNLAQQYIWTKILNPSLYKLKFRIPFQGSIDLGLIKDYMKEDLTIYKEKYKIDQVGDYKKGILTYLPGEIYIQPWAPINSTETRLVGTSADLKKPLVVYKEKDYTAKFFYYNTLYRQCVMHKNNYIDKEREIDHCADCALEIQILEDYKNKVDPTFDILQCIDIFRKLTKFKWKKPYPPHGTFYEPMTYEKIRKFAIKHRVNECKSMPPAI